MTSLKFRFVWLVFLSLAVSFVLNAQNEDGEKLYDRLGYKASISDLKNQEEMDLAIMAKIANSYRLNHDTENAELWYAQVIENSQDPLHFLYYAQALQSNGKIARAKQYYIIYDDMLGGEASDQRGTLLAAAIDRMNEFENTEVEVENVKIINSDKLDFSPSYYKNGLVFVSTRPVERENDDNKDIWIDDNFMSLFFAKTTSEGALETPNEFSEKINTKFHEGPVSFTRNGEQIFFTRNHYNKGKRKNNSKGVMKLQIYTANRTSEGWSDAVELPFNTAEYEEAHPAISPDGKYLYFASDRPDGYGGMDLYVSQFINGSWSAPMNLGENINTAGNELFPFVHDDGTLYFASNGWGGLGGLDIFQSQIQTEEEAWLKAKNIGSPFNSPKDDFGFISNVTGTEGYFTSARKDGFGKDDIYKFNRKGEARTFNTIVCAYEDIESNRLADVSIEIQEVKSDTECDTPPQDLGLTLIESNVENEYLIKLKQRAVCNTANENIFVTNVDGETTVPLFPNKQYVAIATKDGYEVARQEFSTLNKILGIDNLEFCIPLTKRNCATLAGLVNNKTYKKAIPNATVRMINRCTGEQISVQTDANGNFDFGCMECGCDYQLIGNKQYFTTDEKSVSALDVNCKDKSIELQIDFDENANLASTTTINYPSSSSPYPSHNSPPVNINNYYGGAHPSNAPNTYPHSPTFNGNSLKEGAVIELKNIFYDFDKYYIREGAAQELDRIVALMQQYPDMVIELSSHTDARGSEKYNRWLSRKRAIKAVEYITSKGIDSRRLVAAGYGESQLRNDCANFVDCSEEDHQYNRRTEVKIIKFDSSNINVQYIDNAPEKIDSANPKRKYTWK